MNPHSAAVGGSGNPLKSRLESEIWAKICAKSADPFAYSPPSLVKDAVSGRIEFERPSSSRATYLMIESIIATKYKMAAVR